MALVAPIALPGWVPPAANAAVAGAAKGAVFGTQNPPGYTPPGIPTALAAATTPQAAPTPAPGADIASYQPYIDAFTASLGQTRAAVGAQLAQQQQALAGRRDQAAGVIATLPALAQQNYAGAQGGLDAAAAAGQSSLSSDVAGKVGALAGPLGAALQQSQAGETAMQPFLGLANQANYDSGNAQIAAAKADADEQDRSDQRSLQSTLLQAQIQANATKQASEASQQQALQQRGWDVSDNQEKEAFTLAQQQAQQQYTAQQTKKAAKQKVLDSRTAQLQAAGYNTDAATYDKVAENKAVKAIASTLAAYKGEDTLHKFSRAFSASGWQPGSAGKGHQLSETQITANLQAHGLTSAQIEAVVAQHPDWFPARTKTKAAHGVSG